MFRNFECRSCGVTFSADDTNLVECPHCKSDDVVPVRKRNRTMLIAACAICATVLCAIITYYYRNPTPTPNPDTITETEQTEVIGDTREAQTTNENETQIDTGIEPLETSIPVADKSTKTYSITIKTNREPVGTLRYYLTDIENGNKQEYKAKNNTITNIPPASGSNGGYSLHIDDIDSNGNIIDTADAELTGFYKFEDTSIEKLSKEKIQQHINGLLSGNTKLTSITRSNHYTPGVTVHILNGNIVALGEIAREARMAYWTGASVTRVDYNEQGRVQSIYLTPIL